MSSYEVRIRFSPLGDSSTTAEDNVTTRHWALVFSPRSEHNNGRLIELFNGERGSVALITTELDIQLPYHPLANYRGHLADTDRILEAHPMRHTSYSAFFNNCQHFAATFLLLLHAFAEERADRSFVVTYPERMQRVQEVLGREGIKLYHSPNIWLHAARLRLVASASVAWVTASIAAEATVATTVVNTVPDAGILGWFGATTTTTSTIVAPAAYAALAGSAAPVAGTAAILAGVGYKWNAVIWKRKTLFDDPRLVGFPRGVLEPLRIEERTIPEEAKNPLNGLFPHSGSSVSNSGLLASVEGASTVVSTSTATLYSAFQEVAKEGFNSRLKRD